MPVQTFHWEGRQTSWIAPGDQSQAQTLSGASSTTARLFLAGIEVEAPTSARSVVVIGDSITDGATASLDQDQRWTDHLAARLVPYGAAVVNAGISGGRLLHDGMGESALARFQRDVLDQPGVSSVIVLVGINDISWPGTAFARKQARPTLAELQAGYRALAEQAHRRGLRILGATLMPFAGALPGTPLDDYYHPDKDALRRQLNAWLRTDGPFDAVIDLDAALRDPADPSRMAAAYDSGDHLHPGDAGNRAMAEAVDLDVLLGGQGSAGVGSLAPARALTPARDPATKNPGQARGSSHLAGRIGLLALLAHVQHQRVLFQFVAVVGCDLALQLLDLMALELDDLAAVHVDHVVVVAATVKLVDRLAALELCLSTRPAASNWVSTRYTVARPISSPCSSSWR